MLAGFLFAALLAAGAAPARADQDEVHFFKNINVLSGASVRDAVCFFCNATVKGNVSGDIVVFFGNVYIDGAAHHDVVNFFGSITAADNTTIDHDMVNFFGGIHLGENVSVGHDMVAIFGSIHTPDSVSVHGDRVTIPGFIFYVPMTLIVLFVVLIVNVARSRRRRFFAQGYPIPPPL
jgi:hypothetical protein